MESSEISVHQAGMTTFMQSIICRGENTSLQMKPTFKSIGFPAAACVSVNDELVHGIPSGEQSAQRENCKC